MQRLRSHHVRCVAMGAQVLFLALAILTVRDSRAADPPANETPNGTPNGTANPPPNEPPPPTEAQLQAGKAFFLRGQRLYLDGKYGAAWLEFSSAYEITSSPDLIVNMARCKEKMNHPLEATEHYREFLRLRPDRKSVV